MAFVTRLPRGESVRFADDGDGGEEGDEDEESAGASGGEACGDADDGEEDEQEGVGVAAVGHGGACAGLPGLQAGMEVRQEGYPFRAKVVGQRPNHSANTFARRSSQSQGARLAGHRGAT